MVQKKNFFKNNKNFIIIADYHAKIFAHKNILNYSIYSLIDFQIGRLQEREFLFDMNTINKCRSTLQFFFHNVHIFETCYM